MLLAMLAVLIFAAQPPARASGKILVGWSQPLSFIAPGLVYTAYTHHMYYWMCIDDINDAGGLNVPGVGKMTIDYIVVDDGYSETTMLSNYADLMAEGGSYPKCDLLLAPWSSEFNQAVAPLFESNGYPMVGLTVGSDVIAEKCKSGEWTYVFIVLGQPYEDAEQVAQVINFINTKVPTNRITKVAMAYRNDVHGQQHASSMKSKLEGMGLSVPVYYAYEVVPAPSPNWDTFISGCQSNNVDVVMCFGYDEVAGFIQKCIDLDYNPKLVFHGPALETPNMIIQLGFNPGVMTGCVYYNGWPATAYKSPALQAWYDKHRTYSKWFWANKVPPPYGPVNYPYGYAPFPASAAFYLGVEALFRAVEEVGLNGQAIRNRLRDSMNGTAITCTLGIGANIQVRFNIGAGMTISEHGTISQWQGGEMMDVVWPSNKASTDHIIYPKFPWDWGYEPDVNRDGYVDGKDLWLVAKDFGFEGPAYQKRTDVNYCRPELQRADGCVDGKDLWIVAKRYGQEAPYGGWIKY